MRIVENARNAANSVSSVRVPPSVTSVKTTICFMQELATLNALREPWSRLLMRWPVLLTRASQSTPSAPNAWSAHSPTCSIAVLVCSAARMAPMGLNCNVCPVGLAARDVSTPTIANSARTTSTEVRVAAWKSVQVDSLPTKTTKGARTANKTACCVPATVPASSARLVSILRVASACRRARPSTTPTK